MSKLYTYTLYIYNTVWVIEMTTWTNTLGQQYLKYYINLQIILDQIKNNQRINICLVRMLKSYKKLVLHKKFAMVYMYILLQIICRIVLQISLYNFWKITIFLITFIIQKQSFSCVALGRDIMKHGRKRSRKFKKYNSLSGNVKCFIYSNLQTRFYIGFLRKCT